MPPDAAQQCRLTGPRRSDTVSAPGRLTVAGRLSAGPLGGEFREIVGSSTRSRVSSVLGTDRADDSTPRDQPPGRAALSGPFYLVRPTARWRRRGLLGPLGQLRSS